jgi:hypothetical protein
MNNPAHKFILAAILSFKRKADKDTTIRVIGGAR